MLVHSGLGNYSPNKKMKDYIMDELLWDRPYLETKYNSDEYIVIFGHTPTICYGDEYKNRMIKTDSWWDIDTGAALENGRPMLLCLDNGMAYYIEDNGKIIEEERN